MSAWPVLSEATVVNDHHCAAERVRYFLSAFGVECHIFIAALRAIKGSVERIQYDQRWSDALLKDCIDQLLMPSRCDRARLGERQAREHKPKGNDIIPFLCMMEDVEGSNPIPDAILTLESAVYNRALLHPGPSIGNTHCYMKGNIKSPECFATLRLTPGYGQVTTRQELVYQVFALLHPLYLAVVS